MKNNSIWYFIVFSIVIIILVATLSNSNNTIKITGQNTNYVDNTINVSGEGIVFASPDIVKLNIEVKVKEKTTQDAQKKLNKSLAEVLGKLKTNDISDKNIQTTNISLYPEYNYNYNNGNDKTLIGYTASQSLSIKVSDVYGDNIDLPAKIIDEVSGIEGIEINNISYDIEDKTEYYSKARELAIQKAKQKATELANLSDTNISKVLSISENLSYNSPLPMLKNSSTVNFSEDSFGGNISIGELELRINLNVIYGIE